MSYTPTTEQIRKSYAVSRSENLDQTLKRAKAFDRWLQAHDAEVAATALEEAAADIRRNGCLHNDDLRIASEHLLRLAAQKRGA